MSLVTGKRLSRNPLKKKAGRSSVLTSLSKIENRCNDLIRTGLDVMDDETDEKESDYSCDAKIYVLNDDVSCASGSYNSSTMVHAEMNALVDYLKGANDFEDIQTIEITSPPCRSCAFVLELHGLIPCVETTKGIYKNFTGSWSWPKQLQNTNLFDTSRWQTICGWFTGSGLPQDEVLDNVVDVVTTLSSN